MTGQTAVYVQFADTMASRLPLIIAVVVLTAFLLIMSAFRSLVLHHIIHHRGQLTVYLRLNDVAIPAIYGPSADEGAM